MAKIIGISIDKEKINNLPVYTTKEGKQYISLTLSINEELDQYGKDVNVYLTQSAQERQNKVKKIFVGNGKVLMK